MAIPSWLLSWKVRRHYVDSRGCHPQQKVGPASRARQARVEASARRALRAYTSGLCLDARRACRSARGTCGEAGMTEFIQVITTTDTRPRADEIARALVERRLAACVQVVGPVASTFHWQGKIDTAEEWLCLAKTRAGLYE